MTSPVKKLDFGSADKENNPNASATEQSVVKSTPPYTQSATSREVQELKALLAQSQAKIEELTQKNKQDELALVVPTIKPEEADEPLLQDNPNRFVVFPIKYHEVSRDPKRVA